MKLTYFAFAIIWANALWAADTGKNEIGTYLKCDLGLQQGLTKIDDRWIDGKVRIVLDPGKGFYAFCDDKAYYQTVSPETTTFQLRLPCGSKKKFFSYKDRPVRSIGNEGFIWSSTAREIPQARLAPHELSGNKKADALKALKAEVIRRLRYLPTNANNPAYRKDRTDDDFRKALDSCNDVSDSEVKKTYLPYIRGLVFPSNQQASKPETPSAVNEGN